MGGRTTLGGRCAAAARCSAIFAAVAASIAVVVAAMRCNSPRVRPALAKAAALAALGVSTAAAPPGPPSREQGLWIGPIPVCRDTVTQAEEGRDSDTSEPIVVITLMSHWHGRLHAETRRLVEQPLPIRIDGETISEPIVREPIANGKLQVTTTGPDSARIVTAARGPCPGEAAQ